MATMLVMTVSLSGNVPTTLIYHSQKLQNEIERILGILEAPITDKELPEILVSPSKLENYNVSSNLIQSAPEITELLPQVQ